MFVDVKSLPSSVREALAGVRYGRDNIRVEHVDTVSLLTSGGDGARGFTILADLSTGRHETHWGSWGGANMFNRDNAVDLDGREHPIPAGALVIKGHVSSGPTCATIYAARSSSVLPIESGDRPTADETQALYCFASIKGGAYRADEMRRRNVTPAMVEACVARGWVKVNRAGAGQITTAGRNALGGWSGYGEPSAA